MAILVGLSGKENLIERRINYINSVMENVVITSATRTAVGSLNKV